MRKQHKMMRDASLIRVKARREEDNEILHDLVFKSNESSMILDTKFGIKIMSTKPSQTL